MAGKPSIYSAWGQEMLILDDVKSDEKARVPYLNDKFTWYSSSSSVCMWLLVSCVSSLFSIASSSSFISMIVHL